MPGGETRFMDGVFGGGWMFLCVGGGEEDGVVWVIREKKGGYGISWNIRNVWVDGKVYVREGVPKGEGGFSRGKGGVFT